MNITQRRLYMLSFVITFFLTAPLLVFLAKGYTFDRIGKVFVHNGAITIKSNPKKVDLYLDGKKVSKKRLNIINNYYVVNGVRFGSHIIECKKEGYTTWKKKIDVHSGISTEFWNVLLFPIHNKTLHTFPIKNIKHFYLSPRQEDELVLYKEEDDKKIISLFTTGDNKEDIIYSTTDYVTLMPDVDENVEWSSDHKKILVPASINRQNIFKDKEPLNKEVVETTNTISNNDISPTKDVEKDYIILDLKNRMQNRIDLLEILSSIDLSKVDSSPDKNIKENNTTNNDTEKETAEKKNNKTTSSEILADGQPHHSKETINKSTISTENTFSKDISLKLPLNNLKIHQARWMFNSNYQILVLTENHKLFFINIEDPSQSSLLADNVNGFDLAGDHIYYNNFNEKKIIDIKPNKQNYKQTITNTPSEINNSDFVKLFAYDELRMAIITPEKKLYILNKLKSYETISLILIEENIQGVQFSDDGKKLLYWTDNSFWTYMLREWNKQPKRHKDEKIFITNFSSGINNVQWMEAYENIIFTNNGIVKSAELDNRDKINLSNILQAKMPIKDKNCIYDKETSILYFLDGTETQDRNSLKLKSIKVLEKTKLFGFGN